MIRALLFDLDGTLLDSNALIVASFRHTLGVHLGLEPSEAEIHGFFGEHLLATLRRYGPDQVETMLATYRSYNLEHHDRMVQAFPGVPATLRALHEGGLRTAVVTAKLTATAQRGLVLCGLDPYIDVLVGGDAPVPPKPSPEPVRLALERLGVAAAEALMVGDSAFDMEAAKAAGVRVWAVGWSTTPLAQLLELGAERIIQRMDELLALVQNRPGA